MREFKPRLGLLRESLLAPGNFFDIKDGIVRLTEFILDGPIKEESRRIALT